MTTGRTNISPSQRLMERVTTKIKKYTMTNPSETAKAESEGFVMSKGIIFDVPYNI